MIHRVSPSSDPSELTAAERRDELFRFPMDGFVGASEAKLCPGLCHSGVRVGGKGERLPSISITFSLHFLLAVGLKWFLVTRWAYVSMLT